MAQMLSASFGPQNQGVQVGQSYAPISVEFHLPPEQPETTPAPFAHIPFSRDPDFVNRGNILDQLHQRCSAPAGRVALVGLGGVGKSQLAIEYTHRIAAGQPDTWVFWVHAGTQARVEEGFRTIADTVKLPGRNQPKANIPQLVYGWLSNERNGRWIMILDSTDDRDVFCGPTSDDARNRRPFATYLPQSRNGSIIITTRSKDLAFRLTGRYQSIIEVGPMAQTDALTLLEKNQAAAHIQAREPRSSPEKYLAEFRESERKKSKLLEHDAGDLRRDGGASNAILTTWHISFDHIRSHRRSAADLLSLMSVFDRQGIPGWVLNPSRIAKDAIQARDDGADDDVDGGFEDDVAMLRDYCLIVVDDTGDQFEMHGLVQLSTRKWLESFGQLETFKRQCIERLAASFPTREYENWATCRSLFAHVQVVLGYRPSEEMIETWATLLYNGGGYAWLQGRYDVAQRMLGKARKAREKVLGEEDAATLASISLFAMVLLDRGQWEEAERLFVQVMETCKAKLGADHPNTLTVMSNLASTYFNQGRLGEAEKLFVQVMVTSKTKLGADHPDTLTSMGNLASTYRNQGRWEDAEKLDVQGRWEEAEKLQVQVMKTFKTKFGVDHPDTLTSMVNLAATLWNQGRWEEAEKLEVQVMEMHKTKLRADHPDTPRRMGNLALTYKKQGRWEEAEKLLVQVMETRKMKLGADHPDTLTSMANLAFTWKDQGRHADALALIEDCAQARQRVLGQNHPDTLSSLALIAEWSS
ncbi:kinesin light chain [Achaetomium macrosporum]|uniref:Kinesin light chain n=1 Tax=Achaetomium macrosporum TaxID=79813 RepID=A0AAN7C990_9PEZI|nr:kinesin light chain [Achaetomium macrosporum]